MVRLSLSFMSVASAFAVASAVPFFVQNPFTDLPSESRCLPGTSIKEYRSFRLLSLELDTFVSRKIDGTRLVGGVTGNKNLQQLEFCVVSGDIECNPRFLTNCIFENVEYRFRVIGPVKGYLQVDGHYVRIVKDFEDASQMSLSNDDRQGIRITYRHDDGDRNVLATSKLDEQGKPIVLEYPQKNQQRQLFELFDSHGARDMVDYEEHMTNIQEWPEIRQPGNVHKAESLDNNCVPETSIHEYHPFVLKSSNLETLVSKLLTGNYLVGGIPGNKNFQELELCIVSSDYGCNAEIKSNCIYRNVDYRFRVHSPVQGYLRVVGNQVEIVEDFKRASSLNLFKEVGRALRIEHWAHGERQVLSARYHGGPILLEEPVVNAARQWFELIERV